MSRHFAGTGTYGIEVPSGLARKQKVEATRVRLRNLEQGGRKMSKESTPTQRAAFVRSLVSTCIQLVAFLMKMNTEARLRYCMTQIVKEQAFLAKSEADNAKKSPIKEAANKAPHWIHHLEISSPSVIKTDKGTTKTNEGKLIAWCKFQHQCHSVCHQ